MYDNPRTMALLRTCFAALLIAVTGSACLGEADWVLAPDSSAAPVSVTEGASVQLESWRNVSAGLPASGEVGSMAHFDGTIYAVATAGGVGELFALGSGASAWAKTGPAMRGSERPVFVGRFDLAIYLGAADFTSGQGSLYRMELGNESWERLERAPALAPSAMVKKGSELLVAYSGAAAGLYASADRGATWTPRGKATGAGKFLASPVRSLVSSPGAQRLFAAGASGLFYSDDLGARWEMAPLRGSVRALHASEVFVLAEVSGDGTQRSDNYGNTWHPLRGLEGKASSFFLAGARSFAGTANGVKVSDDGGAHWRDSSAGLPAAAEVRGLYLAGSSLFACLGGQVFVAAVR